MKQSLPPVWLITDKDSEDPSFVEATGEDNTPRIIGPFFYSREQDARQAASTQSCLPPALIGSGVMNLDVLEVPGMGLIEGIMTRFSADCDVFAFDEGLFPLTEIGAKWVDGSTETEDWVPLFQSEEKPPKWLIRILNIISGHLGIEPINLKAIDLKTYEAKKVILDKVKIQVILESNPGLGGDLPPIFPGVGTVHGAQQLPSTATYWVHTRGLFEMNRPELEIRHVPAWYVHAAYQTLMGWASHSLNTRINHLDKLREDRGVPVLLKAERSKDEFWTDQDIECLRLRVDQVLFQCSWCPRVPQE